jgi:hypothetical protein|tara:strand:+ start:306 stop:446 length:141 start_codon:yes stop_codon:yes gene_type:complete
MARDPEGKYRAESAIIAELINDPKLLDARFDAVQARAIGTTYLCYP